METKVPVEKLTKGMYVHELDRPWLDTPFLLQGFLIETEEDLAQLRTYCKYVLIDAQRSVGEARALLLAQQPREPAAKPVRKVVRPTYTIHGDLESKKPSLKDDLRAIFKGDVAESSAQERENQENSIRVTGGETVHIPKRGTAAGKSALETSRSAFAEPPDTSLPPIPPGTPTPIVYGAKRKKPGLWSQLTGVFGSKTEQTSEREDHEEVEEKEIQQVSPVLTVRDNKIVASEDLQVAEKVRNVTREALRTVVDDIRKERKIEIEKLEEAVDGMVESISRNPDALIWLTKLKSRDSYAYDHGIDVAIYMLAFGRHLGYPKEQLHVLAIAGLMLDIGKLKIPPDLLAKKGKLNPAEFELIKSHVAHGLNILRDTHDISRQVVQIVAEHHERFDGSGYPRGMRGSEIGTLSSMAGIVDTFEAITSDRPYATALSTHQALKNLYGWKGNYFHTGLVEQFMQCVGIFPVGTLVELNTGEVGIVIAQNKVRRLQPRLMVLLDATKARYTYPVMLDLLANPTGPDGAPYSIRKDLPIGMYSIDAREFYL